MTMVLLNIVSGQTYTHFLLLGSPGIRDICSSQNGRQTGPGKFGLNEKNILLSGVGAAVLKLTIGTYSQTARS